MTICSVRHQGKPLLQPTYNFRDVPTAARDLAGSTLSEVTDRQHFVDSIAELTLLCSEASRRRKNLGRSEKNKKNSSKPLSIEYIFDRIDTDDPMWGYMVRTDTPMSATGRASSLKASPQWRRGMLQGFISVTTFTTWKSSFRFDSLHGEAYSYDDVDLEKEMDGGLRVYDKDGSLAQELESTVHGGDPYVEGIVYPRIAEVSLLGGLGCGKQLLKLVIERLERMKGSSSQNYDYVVLQATENSIPFYESMGFTRVGCIQGKGPSPTGYSSSPVITYVVQKEWEKPVDIAKEFGVDVLDLEFLNIPVWPSFKRNVWLKKGTEVFIPLNNDKDASANSIKNAPVKWYTAKEDETPRGIAMRFKVKYAEFIAANQKRYPSLAGNSRLKDGTRIQISRFDIDDSDYMPYPHWTFPDDDIDEENSEPSYMMALKLNRKSGKAADQKPVADSIAVPIMPYSPDLNGVKELLIEPKVSQINTKTASKITSKEPKKPKRPPSAFLLYCTHARATMKSKLVGKPTVESSKLIGDMWKSMTDEEKAPFYKQFEESKPAYAESLKQYERDLEKFRRENPLSSDQACGVDTSLLEQVVKLKSTNGIPGYASKYEYFYVLTYIPDLMWVHLIPMRKVGVFDENHPYSAGRPIWMIVSEEEGKEFDTSAAICKPVSSRTINNSADADDEQWDIYESGAKPALAPIFVPKKAATDSPKPTGAPQASFSATLGRKDADQTPKTIKRERQPQSASTEKKAKKTPIASSAAKSKSRNPAQIPRSSCNKRKKQSVAPQLPTTPKKGSERTIGSNKRKRSPSKTPRVQSGGLSRSSRVSPVIPERSQKMSNDSIASKVAAGTCIVKVRLGGHILEAPHSLEEVELKNNSPEHSIRSDYVSNPSLIASINAETCALKVRSMDKVIQPPTKTKEETKPSSTASPPSSERALAPLFLKKYTKSTATPSTGSLTTSHSAQRKCSSPCHTPRNQVQSSPRRTPRLRGRSSPRRSPRDHKSKCNSPQSQLSSAFVSDDGLSESSFNEPRRKRTRSQL